MRCVNKKLNLNQLSSIRIAKEDLDKQFYICFILVTDQMDGEDKTGGSRMCDVVRGFAVLGHLLPRTRYVV